MFNKKFTKWFMIYFIMLHFVVLTTIACSFIFSVNQATITVHVSFNVILIQSLILMLVILLHNIFINFNNFLKKIDIKKPLKKNLSEDLDLVWKLIFPSFLLIQGESAFFTSDGLYNTFMAASFSAVLTSILLVAFLLLIISYASLEKLRLNYIKVRILKIIKSIKGKLINLFNTKNLKISELQDNYLYQSELDNFMNVTNEQNIIEFNLLKNEELVLTKKAVGTRVEEN